MEFEWFFLKHTPIPIFTTEFNTFNIIFITVSILVYTGLYYATARSITILLSACRAACVSGGARHKALIVNPSFGVKHPAVPFSGCDRAISPLAVSAGLTGQALPCVDPVPVRGGHSPTRAWQAKTRVGHHGYT